MSLTAARRSAARSQPVPATASRSGSPGLGLFAAGLVILATYAAIALLAGHLAPYDPLAYTGRPLERPSGAHWLGTNDVGQDILSELIAGARVSLAVAILAAVASLTLATACGTAAGYLGGWLDVSALRLTDVLLATPHLPLMILLAAYLPPSVGNTALVIALLGWPVAARAIRAQTLALRSEGYVTAARLLGASPAHVVTRHLIPALGPILVATFVAQASRAVMLEAGLAFLGLGDPLAKSWGAVMRAALSYSGIFFTPHWAWWLLPAAANVSLLILSFSLIGVGLESRLDPRLRRPKA